MTIDEMPAGQEMDALVAEKVMGVKCYCPPKEDCLCHSWSPAYSTDIAAAWGVVEYIRTATRAVNVRTLFASTGPDRYDCGIYDEVPGLDIWVEADTAPLAICRAALHAVGVE